MDLAKSVTRGRMMEAAAGRERSGDWFDPVALALIGAAAALVSRDAMLEDAVREAERLLPANATPLERGMMIGAAMALAMVPGE